MLICAIDTSGRDGSLALAQGDASTLQVLYSVPIAGGTYSAQLIPTLSQALSATGKQMSEIALFAVASGPGSFTGLRVALSTVKALAEVLGAKVIAISVLEAIASSSDAEGEIIAALDAQRNELFVGDYAIANDAMSPGQESLVSAAEFLTTIAARSSKPQVVTSDQSVISRAQEAGIAVKLGPRPNAETYAKLGIRKFLAGEVTSIEDLDANYILRSDAEIFSAPKLGIKAT